MEEVFVISKLIKFEVGFKAVNHLPRPQSFWISQNPNLIIVLFYIEREKIKVMFAFSLMASSTKRTNLT